MVGLLLNSSNATIPGLLIFLTIQQPPRLDFRSIGSGRADTWVGRLMGLRESCVFLVG
jgi:hypothetical protein